MAPIRFSLGGDRGLSILAAGNPRSVNIVCSTGTPVNAVEETSAVGSSGLTYDPGTGLYTYLWKTDRAWAGTCRQFVLKLVDGTEHYADFQFR